MKRVWQEGQVPLLAAGLAALLVIVGAVYWALPTSAIFIGAVYPTNGGQGPGGIEEYRGVELAAQLANGQGGVHGRQIAVHLQQAASADEAPGAVQRLVDQGAQVILGSYGSTISLPASQAAFADGKVFYETGAVGDLGMLAAQVPPPDLGTKVFRFPPAGTVLGKSAIDFIAGQLAKDYPGQTLRYSVAYVDDDYGTEVAAGAQQEIRALGLVTGTVIPYNLRTADYAGMAARIAAAHTNVLFVASYLQDAVALRQQILAQHVPLLISIGTSSSYCLPQFGAELGQQAVGLFASDKPDGTVIKTDNLTPAAARVLDWANRQYRARWGGDLSAAALTGFAGAWGLFHDILPQASSISPDAVAAAARAVDLPLGSLPNGSGLHFGAPGSVKAGENLNALSVIWEWTAPNTRQVVWPPSYATSTIEHLPVSSPA
jgi:branched-chain amino acid transport system substrate-binding protein